MAYDDKPDEREPTAKDLYVFICCGAKQTTTNPKMICLKCHRRNDNGEDTKRRT